MMNKTWKKALSAILTVAMVASSFSGFAAEVKAADTGKVEVTQNGDSVEIGNGYISREFATADGKLSTVEITNKRTDNGETVFTPAEGSEEFIIKTTKAAAAGLSKAGWTATADSWQGSGTDGDASAAIDGSVGTLWHSGYDSSAGLNKRGMPMNFVINLGKETEFAAFGYTGRGNGSNGRINGYEIYLYNGDGATLGFNDAAWGTAVKSGSFADGSDEQYVNFDGTVKATQIRIKITSSYGDQANTFGSAAEFSLYETAPNAGGADDREFAASDLTLVNTTVEATEATINNIAKTGQKVTFEFAPYTHKGVEFSIKEVVVMYDGDHFMRKYMEIEIPEGKEEAVAIDYIDLESLKVSDSDAQWTIPTTAGGIVEMDQFKANLGQPIYIQGMFFGCEFPETDTQIANGTGYMRYYTGKNFKQFEEGNQLTTDGKYVTWQTVAGAARSTDNQVIQADFFEYIYSIATPSDFRIQYNSWFDNMMLISDESILKSFIEVDRELNKVETRPLDSYVVDDGWINYNDTHVVDANRAGTTLNQTGFWEFNSKFPNGLTTSSDLVHNFGSNFGVWVGPRGGYNFYGQLANIIQKAEKGSKAGGSIDVADSTYHENLTKLFTDWQKEYGVNYWKWDGYADRAQYNSFPAADGVPGYANDHMTGGYQHMYHVTDLWEGWIDIFEAVRASEEADGINKLWLSLTCYVNPSPWFLQWANSVWLQCTHDQNDSGSSSSKMDRQLTYRDAAYYEFINKHQFQFPLANVYNHDPIYGKEGTGMGKNTATDEQFKNYLYAQSARGTAFWELYYSDSIMTDGKYEITGEFLAWAEANNHMLRNAKMFGGHPSTSVKLSNGGGAYSGTQDAYGFAGFDGNDGIITIRNAAQSAKTVTMKFDRTIGVPEDAGTLKYHLEHTHNLTAGTPATGEFTYGESYTFTLQADEVRMFRVSKDGDQTVPEFTRAFSDGNKEITVKFNEKVTGDEFTVAGATVESVTKSPDGITYRITLAEALADNAVVEVAAADIKDLAGNACADTISFVNYAGNVVTRGAADAAESLVSDNGFTVAATVTAATAGTVVAQGDAYVLGINEDGKATFTLNGSTAVSKSTVVDGDTIVGVKENNGIQKIYVNGTLESSAYDADNRYYDVAAAAITVENADEAIVRSTAYGYDAVADVFGAAGEEVEDLQITTGISATVSGDCGEDASDINNIFDGDPTTYWNSNSVASIAAGNPYAVVDLGKVYNINQIDFSPRYHSSENWHCTGNIKKLVLEVSVDGETWTAVTPEGGLDISSKIVKPGDVNLFPINVTFDKTEAKYVRISGTESYHWQASSLNTSITIGDIAIFRVPDPKPVELPLEAYVATTAGDEELDGGAAEGPAVLATDNDESTKWHTDWYAGPNHDNHWLQVELDDVYAVSGYKYLPRQDSSPNGRITGYQIQLSLDGENWTVAAEGTWDTTTDWKEVSFDAQNAKYVRLQTTAATSDQQLKFASAAEVRVVGYVGEAPEKPVDPQPPVVEVNKEALTAAIADAAAYAEEDYTAETWAAFAAALAEAEETLANADATQDMVDLAVEFLEAAAEALVEKEEPVDPQPPVDPKPEAVKIENVTVSASSVDTTEPEHNKEPENVLDGNNKTFWATVPNGSLADAWFQVAFDKPYMVSQVDYTGRWDDGAKWNCTGNLLAYEIEVSMDGENWTPVASGDVADGKAVATFEAVEANYVRVKGTSSYHWQDGTNGNPDNRNTVMCIGDLAVYGYEVPETPVDPQPPVDPEPPVKDDVSEVFPDVEDGAWYEADVQYVYDNGIMSGSNGLFNPTKNVTRAQVVTTLYNLEGKPEVTDFSAVEELVDVQAGEWYTNAVCWAYSVGVASGNGATKMFNMNDPVTRQQLATFFFKYAEYKDLDTETRGDYSELLGADQVAGYAAEAMQWAFGEGIITGSATEGADGTTVYDLKPTGTATRAQMASILMRFREGNDL